MKIIIIIIIIITCIIITNSITLTPDMKYNDEINIHVYLYYYLNNIKILFIL